MPLVSSWDENKGVAIDHRYTDWPSSISISLDNFHFPIELCMAIRQQVNIHNELISFG